MNRYNETIAREMVLSPRAVGNTIELLDQGATIPFISRYRKERTGGLDEVQIATIAGLLDKCRELDKRRESILNSLRETGKLSEDLRRRIEEASSMTQLEDIYLPYRPKRRTRAAMAREKGLEPLARIIMSQHEGSLQTLSRNYLNEQVSAEEEALAGASDIIAEWISEDERARRIVRRHYRKEAVIRSKVVKGKEEQAENFRDYFDFSEPLHHCSSHRFLAMSRGLDLGLLRLSISPDNDKCQEELESCFVRGNSESAQVVRAAVRDSYKRLLSPAIETEFGNLAKEKADDQAIRVFSDNLRQLLMGAPLGQKRIMGIDPGYRTGCKVVCLDAQGKLLHNEAIYPHPPQNQRTLAERKIAHMVESYDIQAIAIGNGTASRETERFIQNIRFDRKVQVFVVSENGASVYSASAVAREEFPDYDVTVRGAVSIARRLGDPLAELVKIEPKSIGVGQYQHDVDQDKLKKALEETVISCVNAVGVNLNTASRYLLTYVSGLNTQTARNIVSWRDEHGAFASREELRQVPHIGDKTFEQAAGFLRITDGDNPLDNTAVHPERYALVGRMAEDLGCSVEDLIGQAAIREKIDLKRYVSDDIGLPTLTDILQELAKPGRDPRRQAEVFSFDPDIRQITDLREGMVLPGIVTNITNFGAFVDIGIKENGLLHVSQMADRFVRSPQDIVSIHQQLRVKVIGIDLERRRIQLSLKGL